MIQAGPKRKKGTGLVQNATTTTSLGEMFATVVKHRSQEVAEASAATIEAETAEVVDIAEAVEDIVETTEAEIAVSWSKLDIDGDGEIDLEEFIAVLREQQQKLRKATGGEGASRTLGVLSVERHATAEARQPPPTAPLQPAPAPAPPPAAP